MRELWLDALAAKPEIKQTTGRHMLWKHWERKSEKMREKGKKWVREGSTRSRNIRQVCWLVGCSYLEERTDWKRKNLPRMLMLKWGEKLRITDRQWQKDSEKTIYGKGWTFTATLSVTCQTKSEQQRYAVAVVVGAIKTSCHKLNDIFLMINILKHSPIFFTYYYFSNFSKPVVDNFNFLLLVWVQ